MEMSGQDVVKQLYKLSVKCMPLEDQIVSTSQGTCVLNCSKTVVQINITVQFFFPFLSPNESVSFVECDVDDITRF